MKLCRFNEKGIAAVRELLPQIKTVDDLARAEALVSNADFIDPIPALVDIDLDASRIFPTTFAFCEYFHSLMKDHKPLAYRTDVGFWTWLAMVYVRQLVKVSDNHLKTGELARLVYNSSFGQAHRHLLASPYYVFILYADDASICRAVLWNALPVRGDIQEFILSNQVIVQNPALLSAVDKLYFDEIGQTLKRGSGSKGPGSPRRFVTAVDQFGMTKDFFDKGDVNEFLRMLPSEFDGFNPLKA